MGRSHQRAAGPEVGCAVHRVIDLTRDRQAWKEEGEYGGEGDYLEGEDVGQGYRSRGDGKRGTMGRCRRLYLIRQVANKEDISEI